MLSNDQIQKLKSENEWLHVQLEDMTEMIRLREEELEIVKKKASEKVMLQSQLDNNQDEFQQLQKFIIDEKIKVENALRREAVLEEEMLKSIKIETDYYTLKDNYSSTSAALFDRNNELAQTAALHQEIAILNSKIALLASNLEIAKLENTFLKEDIEKYRRQLDLSPRG